jgi:hypothetical protein
MAEWTRIVHTTTAQFIRQVEENILRNRKLLALLKSKGRITFNHSGTELDWKVRYRRAPIRGFADSDTLSFPRHERFKTCKLDWRGYATTDAMTKRERLINKNTEAIVKVYSDIATSLMDDIDDQFGDELYVDGNASGNSKRIHGIESFMGNAGASPAGYVGLPSDTYAGLLTNLAGYGGAWSTNSSGQSTWPTGTGDAHYDFFSPLIVDYKNASWTPQTKTWATTAKEALRFGIIKGKKNKSKKGQLDVVIIDDEMYRQFLGLLDDKERLVVQRGDKQGLYALGFTDVVNFDGVDVTSEYGVPPGVGYGWSIQNLELCSLQPQLFVPEGPDFDIATQSYRFSVDFFGNMKFNPRYFVKWMAIS